jgi:translation initiation factor IF-1
VGEVANKIDHNHTIKKGQSYSRKLEVEDIQIGDKVTIVNPTKYQQNKGTVTGFTMTGQVRVRTNNGSIVRRRAFNLQHQ